jgi:hypothetical protein
MSESKVGSEFITHEFDEAIAVQRTIVEAEEQLSRSHPLAEAKGAIKASLKDDRQYLAQLEKLGKEHGATGKVEEVAGGLQHLMQETVQKAAEAESEAYEAHAVLLNLKRKQQDSAAAMLKIARAQRNTKLRDAALQFERGTRESAKELSSQLASFAVRIATKGQGGRRAQAARQGV